MKRAPNKEAEKFRVQGPKGTNSGAFEFPGKLRAIVSDGGGWDHVSVSYENEKYMPTYGDLSRVRDLFFQDSETVMQLFVPKTDHINLRKNCLHLWRPQSQEEIAVIRAEWGKEWPHGDLESPGNIPVPPKEMV